MNAVLTGNLVHRLLLFQSLQSYSPLGLRAVSLAFYCHRFPLVVWTFFYLSEWSKIWGVSYSPIVHSVHTTAANEHDVTQAHHLLHGEEKRVFADAGYQGVEKRPEHEGRDTNWYIAMRPGARRALGDSEDDIETRTIERLKSKFRAHVEHPFRVIKEQFGYRKVRYKGLAKNTNHLYMLFALSNLYLCRRQLAN